MEGNYFEEGGRSFGVVFCFLLFFTVICKVKFGGLGVFLKEVWGGMWFVEELFLVRRMKGKVGGDKDGGFWVLVYSLVCGNLWFWE